MGRWEYQVACHQHGVWGRNGNGWTMCDNQSMGPDYEGILISEPVEVLEVRGLLQEGASPNDLARWRKEYLAKGGFMSDSLQLKLLCEVTSRGTPSEYWLTMLSAVAGGEHAGTTNTFRKFARGLLAGRRHDRDGDWCLAILHRWPRAAAALALEGRELRETALPPDRLDSQHPSWTGAWRKIWAEATQSYLSIPPLQPETLREDGVRSDGILVGLACVAGQLEGRVRMNTRLANRLKQDITTLMPLEWLPGSIPRVEALERVVDQVLSAERRRDLRRLAKGAPSTVPAMKQRSF